MKSLAIFTDLEYLAIFASVLILPKVLLRFRFPSGITALTLGILAGHLDPGIKSDPLFRFLSQIGITSLFVFAGFEVDFKELKEDRVYLSKYLGKSIIILGLIAYAINYFMGLPLQETFILSLGIFTPSAGFIMNSLHSFNMSEDQEYWVKSKAISKEFISIVLLFVALQGNNPKALAASGAFYVGLVIFLPMLFRLFFKFVAPHAPNSEVPFMIALALISGVISKELGAYYLVGAFIVGLISSRFKHEVFHEEEEAIFNSLSNFFSVFLPFYFFSAGFKLDIAGFTLDALMLGSAAFVIFVPLRLLMINVSLKFFLEDIKEKYLQISLSLMPTLIFGLVIASILKTRGVLETKYVYGLLVYTIFASLLPTVLQLIRRSRSQESS